MTNLPGYLAGNRTGSTGITDSDTGSGAGSLTDSSYVRAIASRPVPALPDLSRPNPGAIPTHRDKQLNGNHPLSAVDAEVAGAREAPAMTRPQAMTTARRMHEGGWQQVQIREYLAARGQRVARSTLRAWVDPEYAERRREADKLRKRHAWRQRNGCYGPRVLDIDLMLALRVEDGLSYTAISKVAGRIYGQKLSEGQVRDRLNRHGVPKNPAKVRSARNFTRGEATL